MVVLSLESNCGRFRLPGRCWGSLLWYDSRRDKRRSVFLFLSVLGSRRIFRLTPDPSAWLAFERVEKLVGVRDADHLPDRAPMAEQVLLAAADLGEPVHPGQDARVLQRGDRNTDRVAVTLRGSGDSLVARKAPPAAIGAVEAPQQRPQHSEARPGQRTLVLPGLAIRRVVGRRRGPQPSLGVAVEAMRGGVSENLLAPGPQMSRQNKLQCGPFRPRQAQTFPVSGNYPLDGRSEFRGSSRLPDREFPRSDRMQGPPSAGFCFFWAIALQKVDDPGQLAAVAGGVQCGCSSAAEILAVRAGKYATVADLLPNQRRPHRR